MRKQVKFYEVSIATDNMQMEKQVDIENVKVSIPVVFGTLPMDILGKPTKPETITVQHITGQLNVRTNWFHVDETPLTKLLDELGFDIVETVENRGE